jgi:hypothetical protein
MKKVLYVSLAAAAVAALALGSFALANGGGKKNIKAGPLISYQEVPALSTPGKGSFKATISDNPQQIQYTESYSNLDGVATQSHIHFGQRSVNGGISVFLCTNLGNGPAGTQACPPAPATISGTLTPADVIGPAGQGIAAGEWNELVAAIRAGKAYVNVHTDKFPGGEIRSQLNSRHD